VILQRVNGKIIYEGTTRVQSFEAGEIDALDGGALPRGQMARLEQLREYEKYPILGTYYYGFNVKNVPDVHERRALSLAIPRRTIAESIARAGQVPATGFTPQGIPGFDQINPSSPWTPADGDLDRARQELAQAQSLNRNLTLFVNDFSHNREIAAAIQAAWKKLGIRTTIKQQEWEQFLQFLGPPPNNAVDVYRLGWLADYADAINFLDIWTCTSVYNTTNWCDPGYDMLVAKAHETQDDEARYVIYRQLEERLLGADGAVPVTPIYWFADPNLEHLNIKSTFSINPLDQIDLTKVVVARES
jgi:oligopeptide transport system substrate-binding protein